MSPATLRRYRAERLLRRDFDGLRGRVLAAVRARLRSRGMDISEADLEGCYSQAWHGLYAASLEGEEILNPCAWLVLVTFRRAVEEHRSRRRHEARLAPGGGEGEELAARLDDRDRLRQLMQGLRARLDERERTAATLCYLQGLSREQAAAQMGVSPGRMRKLMEGRGRGSVGVSAKVGALVAEISQGSFCESQASLMRALALGVLEPGGERHGLALAHSNQCPACRRYVASLRGLAAALPPSFAGARLAAQLGRLLHGLAGGAGARGGGVAGGGTAAASSGAAAGGGAAGGGWLVGAGPLGAKLAVGCLLAVGVGAGCVTLESGAVHRPDRRRTLHTALAARRAASAGVVQEASAGVPAASRSAAASGRASTAPLTASAHASREFGPEQAGGEGAGASGGSGGAVAGAGALSARVASAGSGPAGSSGQSVPALATRTGGQASAGSARAAEREFSP
jgi:DNA-directed RNA polymerase specialized sigma24 family protein